MVSRLLRAGADVNAPASKYANRTALQAAAENGHKAVVSRLLEAGADVGARAAERSGLTALQAATECGDEILVRLPNSHMKDAAPQSL
ncbi:MAG: hypothetical protein M1813_005443 [Trichoglossum hirsutum]|nr:MAG: hypothetical protein M1813_005443 [Trichoglossum hirsutum]